MKIDTNLIAKGSKSTIGNSSSPFSRKETLVGRLARTSLLLLFVLCSAMVSAQQKEVTLTEAGTLSEKIDAAQKYTITSLKVSGPINGTDVRFLREMAGTNVYGFSSGGVLADLDLTDANIVEGGDYYYYGTNYRTENDVLGSCTFRYCKLTSIKIPNSVTSIGEYAFHDCSSLTSIDIPNSVTYIGRSAFYGCSSLTSVTIGNSVASIGNWAFSYCQSLTSIAVEEGNTYYHTDGSCLIETASNTLIRGCNLTSVTIPNYVTSIGNSAFDGCSSLTSIDIPNSVTSIGDCAFYYCSGLTSVTIGESVTSIGNGAFDGCSAITKLVSLNTTPPTCGVWALLGIDKEKCTLYVPKNSLEAYKAADQWKDFKNMEEMEDTGVSLPGSNGNNKVVKRYDTNGRMTDKPFKGLNILKMGDGTTRKVMVK